MERNPTNNFKSVVDLFGHFGLPLSEISGSARDWLPFSFSVHCASSSGSDNVIGYVIFVRQITQLKIDHNPFAKGFRVCGSTVKIDKRYSTFLVAFTWVAVSCQDLFVVNITDLIN